MLDKNNKKNSCVRVYRMYPLLYLVAFLWKVSRVYVSIKYIPLHSKGHLPSAVYLKGTST